MNKGAGRELSYHRRRAAEERGLSERAAGIAAARSHKTLAALHADRAEAIEGAAAQLERRWAGPEVQARPTP